MSKLGTLVLPVLCAFALGLFSLAPAHAASNDQQQLVDGANLAIQAINNKSDDPVAKQARDLIRKARAVMIMPSLVKGGFFLGGQGGSGVLLARDPKTGDWGYPGFYWSASGSFGLQIGVSVSQVVLIIMNDKALSAIMKNQFKVGAEAGIAVATLGAGAEANTTSAGGADIYGFSVSQGLFGGIAVSGGVIHPRDSWDAAYYGKSVSSSHVIHRQDVSNPGADALRHTLKTL